MTDAESGAKYTSRASYIYSEEKKNNSDYITVTSVKFSHFCPRKKHLSNQQTNIETYMNFHSPLITFFLFTFIFIMRFFFIFVSKNHFLFIT